LRGDALHLLGNNVERPLRQDAGHGGEVVVDGCGVGEQAVERYERGDARKNREERIESDAGGDGEQPVLAHLLIDAPRHVLPALGRDLGRLVGGAPAVLFARRDALCLGARPRADGALLPGLLTGLDLPARSAPAAEHDLAERLAPFRRYKADKRKPEKDRP
jgi:hypothetical protein